VKKGGRRKRERGRNKRAEQREVGYLDGSDERRTVPVDVCLVDPAAYAMAGVVHTATVYFLSK
jgi:hypothetical protein